MGIATSFLPEFDAEVATTRRVLERVPCDRLEWRPHAKSFSMHQLAGHVSQLPGWLSITIDGDSFDAGAAEGREKFSFSTTGELLAHFDANIAAARAALESATDERMLGPWSLIVNGTPVFTLPRVAVVRSFVMNHLIHHRAQLALYLRLNGIPVPSIYGPSADDPGF